MRLLQVISTMDPFAGGTSGAVRNLTPSVCDQSHEVEILCHDDPGSEYLKHETLPIHALGQGRGSWSYHPALRPWFHQNLARFQAVVLNGLWQYPGYALARATQGGNVPPYFVFPHGMLDPWFQRAPERRLKAIRNWCYWKLIEQHVIRNARALLFTCAEEMRLARQTFRPYRPQNQVCVGYGVRPPPAFHPDQRRAFEERCPELRGRPYHLFLGRLHPKKGLDLLINAYAEICRPGPARARPVPTLVIAGPGLETPFGSRMQDLAATTCPPGSVLWPGMLTGDAKWGALYQAETFVLASHQENFGLAVVEALACGTPVLVSNQVNIAGDIAADNAGFIAPDSVPGTLELLRRWDQVSNEGRRAMSAAALRCYTSRFGISQVAQRLMNAIQMFT